MSLVVRNAKYEGVKGLELAKVQGVPSLAGAKVPRPGTRSRIPSPNSDTQTSLSYTFYHPIFTTAFVTALQVTADCHIDHTLLPLTWYADAKKLGESWGRAQSKARAGGLAPPGGLKGGLDKWK